MQPLITRCYHKIYLRLHFCSFICCIIDPKGSSADTLESLWLGHQVKAWWPNRRSKSQTLIQQFKIALPFLSVFLLKTTDLLPFLSWLLQKHSTDLSLVKRSWLFSLVLEILMEYSHVYPGREADKHRVCCILAGAVKILLWTAVANWHSVDCWGHWISLP